MAEVPQTGARGAARVPLPPPPTQNTYLRQPFVFFRTFGLLSQRRHVVPEQAKDSAKPNTIEEASPHRRQTSCIAKIRVVPKAATCPQNSGVRASVMTGDEQRHEIAADRTTL